MRIKNPMKTKAAGVALVIAVLSGFSAVSSEVTLVENGTPRAVIVLEAHPTRAAQMGALELNHHVKLITGSELPVVRGEAETTINAMPLKIHIGGTPGLTPSEKLSIKFTPGVIRLDGFDSTDRETVDYMNRFTFPSNAASQYLTPLFAVYEFLENHCGVRFYGFFDMDTVYSPRRTLCVAVRDIESEPACPAFREVGTVMMTPGSDPDKRDVYLWRLRLRMNSIYGQVNHNVRSIYFAHWGEAEHAQLKSAFKSRRPELFAQKCEALGVQRDPLLKVAYPEANKIPPQLCYSHPDTIRYFANQAVTYLNGKTVPGGWGRGRIHTYPGLPFYYPIQGLDYATGFCRCEKCAPRYQSEEDISDYTFQFVSDIAREASELDPRAGISTLAYVGTYGYPEKVPLADNLSVQLCPVIYSWWHPIVRERQHGMYKRWIEAERGRRPISLWLYLYAGGPWDAKYHYGNYRSFVDVWYWNAGKILKEFVDDKVAGLFVSVDVTYMLPGAYLAMRLAWDGDANPEKLLDEYFTRYYGAAGGAMQAFFRKCEALYWNSNKYSEFLSPARNRNGIASPKGLRHNYWTTGLIDQNADFAHITENDMEELEGFLRQAEAAAGEPEKPRIARVRKGIWATAQDGFRDYQNRQIYHKTPSRLLTPMAVEGTGAAGDPAKIEWGNIPDSASWVTLLGEDSGSFCSVRTAVDADYFYCELRDPAGNLPNSKLSRWHDDFEIFFKPVGDLSYQLCIFPNAPALALAWENGEKKQTQLQEKAISQHASDGSWTVRLAIPRQQIGMTGQSEYRINFARVRGDSTSVWNPTFIHSLPSGVNRGGIFCLNPGDEAGGNQVLIKPGLTNWKAIRSKNCSLDTEVKKVSDASIRLGSDSRVEQAVTMEPGSIYRVSFFIRGEEIAGPGARMIIKSDSRWMRIVANASREGDYETGTFDWKKADTRIEIRPTESGNVKISFDLTGSGTAWFDGLKIEKVMD